MAYLTFIGAVFIAWLILNTLFAPAIPYHLQAVIDARSDQFLHVIESTCQTIVQRGNRVDILTNGPQFYPAMLDAIRSARTSINMECYIFKAGDIGKQFIDALIDRARAGVKVTMVMDAIGSWGTYHHAGKALREAGVRVERYQRLSWYRLARLNNRTHRELLVVDGRVAFVGGAGVADWWAKTTKKKAMWRDTMARVEGPVVAAIQGVFAENWLETCGEILTSDEHFGELPAAGTVAAFAVKSSPSDRATVNRVLFQALVEGASQRLLISTPYFLPDKAFRAALSRTARRGIDVQVIVPGHDTDQHWVRLASRRMYGRLLEHGVRIFEYNGRMTHAKILLVDGLWAVLGTTNIDNRSFEHNDEVNLAIRDEGVVRRLTGDFESDLRDCCEIGLDAWRRRPMLEKLVGTVAWILERQQ